MGLCFKAISLTRPAFKTRGGAYGKEEEGQRLRHRDTLPRGGGAGLRPAPGEIQSFFESEEGQREFTEWKAQQEKDKLKQN